MGTFSDRRAPRVRKYFRCRIATARMTYFVHSGSRPKGSTPDEPRASGTRAMRRRRARRGAARARRRPPRPPSPGAATGGQAPRAWRGRFVRVRAMRRRAVRLDFGARLAIGELRAGRPLWTSRGLRSTALCSPRERIDAGHAVDPARARAGRRGRRRRAVEPVSSGRPLARPRLAPSALSRSHLAGGARARRVPGRWRRAAPRGARSGAAPTRRRRP